MRRLILPVATLGVLSLVACGDDTATTDSGDSAGSTTGLTDSSEPDDDFDGDGISASEGDCNDDDPTIYPGRGEECNGVDDNCNDQIDEGQPDTDGDGTADCMDVEECDGVDNNGDGDIDEGFEDIDGDGHADCISTELCDGVDNDGDALVDEGFDADGDGHAECTTDCDDEDAAINPDALEVAGDLEDNDCDGMVDEVEWAEGDLVITELMVNPVVTSDAKGEWIEVKNTTSRVLYLNGLMLTSSVDGDTHAIEHDDMVVLAAGETMVWGNNSDSSTNGLVTVDYAYSDFSLSNEFDELTLHAGDILLDTVSWDDGSTMPDPEGASIQLDPFFLTASENDNPDYWCDAVDAWGTGTDLGSPGEANPLCHDTDHDGDGFTTSEGDCDDLDPDAYPSAPEKDASKDNDCDGDIEDMPTADAGYDTDSTLYHCSGLLLDGSGSSDPSGDSLTYAWDLASAPAASALTTSDIQSSTDAQPIFYPDVAGTYVFMLTVTDAGGAFSYPDTLTISIAERLDNTEPVANAGGTQTYSEDVSCQAFSYGEYYTCDDCADYDHTLDGGDSSDPDGDELTYSWAVLIGDGTLTDETTSSPTLTQTGPSTEYGETNAESVTVELTVTDCMGATHTDTVDVNFECTGT
jgi:hypothetical protein